MKEQLLAELTARVEIEGFGKANAKLAAFDSSLAKTDRSLRKTAKSMSTVARKGGRAFDMLGAKAEQNGRTMSAVWRKQQQSLAGVATAARRASNALVAGAESASSEAIKTRKTYESQMARIGTATYSAGRQMDTLGLSSSKLGSKTKSSTSEASEALAGLASVAAQTLFQVGVDGGRRASEGMKGGILAGGPAVRTAAEKSLAAANSSAAQSGKVADGAKKAGGTWAKKLGLGLRKALPGAMAQYAIGDVVETAVKGDFESAGIKSGGALVGGIAGAFFGPGGAMIGASLGSVAAPWGVKLVKGLLGGAESEIPTAVQRLAESSKTVAAAMAHEMSATKGMKLASRGVVAARDRQKTAADAVKRAEKGLQRARRVHGKDSKQAIVAEIGLARAKDRSATASKKVQSSERMSGAVRKATKAVLKDTVTEEKAHLKLLRSERKQKLKALTAANKHAAGTDRQRKALHAFNKKNREVNQVQGTLSSTLRRAANQIGPKFAKQLKGMSTNTAALTRGLGLTAGSSKKAIGQLERLPAPLKQFSKTSKDKFGLAELSVDDYHRMVKNRRKSINTNMRTLPTVTRGSLDLVVDVFEESKAAIDNGGKPKVKKRRGGPIRKYARGGEVARVAVSSGEEIHHRGRVFTVPGKPVARDNVVMDAPVGAKVLTFDGQRRMAEGDSLSTAMNRQLPHFGKGGSIPNPRIAGGSTRGREVGNLAVSKVRKAAVSRLAELRKQARAAAGSVPGYVGPPANMKRLGDNAWVDSHTLAVAAYLSNKFSVGINSGYRSPGENAATPGASATSSHMRGSPSNPGAIDFGPPSTALQSFAGAHIAGLTENMIHDAGTGLHNHIAFFRRGGKVKGHGKGGKILSFRRGGWLKKIKHWGPNMLATLAAHVGMDNPGLMSQIARGESAGNPRAVGDDAAAGYGNTFGLGLWQITTGVGNDDLIEKYGGREAMFNPLLNAKAAKEILDRQGIGAWYANPTGPAGVVDPDFMNILRYSPAERQKAKKRSARKKKAIGKLRKTAGKVGVGKGTKKRLKLATKFARKAAGAAKDNDVAGSDSLRKKATGFGKKARAGIEKRREQKRRQRRKQKNKRGRGSGNDEQKPSDPRPGPGSGGDPDQVGAGSPTGWKPNDPYGPDTFPGEEHIPGDYSDLINGPGMSWQAKRELLDGALSLAERTETTDDDAAVLGAKLGMERDKLGRNQQRVTGLNEKIGELGGVEEIQKLDGKIGGLKAREEELERQLKRTPKGKKGKGKRQRLRERLRKLKELRRDRSAERKKITDKIAKRDTALGNVSEAQGAITGIEQNLVDLNPEKEDNSAELAEAIKALKESIDKQNELQQKTQGAVGSELGRALTDYLSGQLVGSQPGFGASNPNVRY